MKDCIFCQISQKEINSWQIYENKHVLAFLDINPINDYHTLVIPKKHYTNIFVTPELVLQEIMVVIKKLTTLYQKKLGLQNVQILNNSGIEAQQEVLHLHFHIIPRYKSDQQNIIRNSRVNTEKDFATLMTKLDL